MNLLHTWFSRERNKKNSSDRGFWNDDIKLLINTEDIFEKSFSMKKKYELCHRKCVLHLKVHCLKDRQPSSFLTLTLWKLCYNSSFLSNWLHRNTIIVLPKQFHSFLGKENYFLLGKYLSASGQSFQHLWCVHMTWKLFLSWQV